MTVYQIAETVGISVGSAHSILHDDLCLSKLSARWVPKALRPNQLNLRSELSTAILLKIEADKDCFFGLHLKKIFLLTEQLKRILPNFGALRSKITFVFAHHVNFFAKCISIFCRSRVKSCFYSQFA